MILDYLAMLLWCLFGHFIGDYALQSDFMAQRKCRRNSLANVPWYYVMSGHAATHAAAVGLATGSVWLALAEFAAHWILDFAKCEGWTNIHVDQLLHIICKFAWCAIVFAPRWLAP